MKLNKIGQHILIKVSLEIQKYPTGFFMVSSCAYFSHYPFFIQASDTNSLSRSGAMSKLPLPQHPWD